MALGMLQPEEEIEEKEERAKKDAFYGKERERETAGVGRGRGGLRRKAILCVLSRIKYNQL